MGAATRMLLLAGLAFPQAVWAACPAPYDTGKLLDDLVRVETSLRKSDGGGAGTVAADPSVGVKGQTEQILKRIDELLATAGTNKSRILTATVWLANMGHYDEMNAAWDAWLDKANPPARATVESHLATPKYQVEIACIAAR